MPRPSKRVSPDTLGGRIRVARQNLHLSLAEVAGDRYSTSLISQIERNRVDPSQESLQYLAERLKLPLEDLTILARQHRESEFEAQRYKEYDEIRLHAQQTLDGNHPHEALGELASFELRRLPSPLRWRIAALRGQCYFSLREFLEAQRLFLYALAEKPVLVPADQSLEAMLLLLHLAAADRELGLLDDAAEHYGAALKMMNPSTSLRHVAEAHWGMALVSFELARRAPDASLLNGSQLQTALKHAESARTLYHAIGDELNAASLTCEIALIEEAAGNLDKARAALQEILTTWRSKLAEPVDNTSANQRRKKDYANVLSAAACYLADIELSDKHYAKALEYVQQAQQAGEQSYILRRAEAAMMLGRILEAQGLEHPERDDDAAEQAFRKAIVELEPTDRLAAKIHAHDLLGQHLLLKGKLDEGRKEIERARQLSHFVPKFSSAITPENEPNAIN